MMRCLPVLFAFALLPLRAVEFDSAFSSGMVLQRELPIRVSGKGERGREVVVSFGAKTQKARVDADGTWSVEFPAMPAGGPHEITAVDGSQSATIDDVLVGDVWLCSGQSNMQMGLHETICGEAAMAEPHPGIRILTVPRGGADAPTRNFDAKWQHASPETLRDFSAVGYYFALGLEKSPALAEVPIGIINSSFGGTPIEVWMPRLPKIPKEQISDSMFGMPPGALYNGMIAPLTMLKLKGAVWYQGESNAGRPQAYTDLLAEMIRQWRAQFDQPELPFFIVQLPAFEGRIGDLDFSWLREAQAAACKKTPHTFLAVTYDTTDGFDLHPREKQEIGRRIARLAEREVYGRNVVSAGPVATAAKSEGDRIVVTFDQPVSGRGGAAVKGFAIAGDDGDFRFADAVVDGSRVLLRAEGVSNPKWVRYAWGGLPDANLVNAGDLPAAPFRMDRFEPGSVHFQPLPTAYRIDMSDWQMESGRGGRIASLVIGGRQFLSNEPEGGTRVPTIFGPRNLSRVHKIGPARMAFGDDAVTVEVGAAADGMDWMITNTSNVELEFHVALAPAVEVSKDGISFVFRRDDVRVKVDGIDRMEGMSAIVKIPPHESRAVRWNIPRGDK